MGTDLVAYNGVAVQPAVQKITMHLQMDDYTVAYLQNEDAQFQTLQKATEESEDSDAIALHKAWENTWNKLRDNEIVIKDTYSDKCGFTQYRAEAIKKATNYIRTLGLNIYSKRNKLFTRHCYVIQQIFSKIFIDYQ